MTVTAKDVANLRKATNAGMMDCKKALQESGGDFDGAIDILRKKGQKVAAKRADKEANEGAVVAITNEEGTQGIVLVLGCETDFVAKNDEFVALANALGKLALDNGCTTAAEVLALPYDGGTVSEKLVEQTGTVGEKIEIPGFARIEGDNLATYVHGGRIGVILSYNDGGSDDAHAFFRSVAMHVAAMSPRVLSPDELDLEFIVKETESLQGQIKIENEDRARLSKPLRTIPRFGGRAQLTDDVMAEVEQQIKDELKAEGKPEKIWDKIVPGKIDRFIADNTQIDQEHCLLSQFFAVDDTKTVAQAVKDFHPDADVVAFCRVATG